MESVQIPARKLNAQFAVPQVPQSQFRKVTEPRYSTSIQRLNSRPGIWRRYNLQDCSVSNARSIPSYPLRNNCRTQYDISEDNTLNITLTFFAQLHSTPAKAISPRRSLLFRSPLHQLRNCLTHPVHANRLHPANRRPLLPTFLCHLCR